jgi:hypothetical protein
MECKCLRCGYTWRSIKTDYYGREMTPKTCLSCKSYQWTKPKKEKYENKKCTNCGEIEKMEENQTLCRACIDAISGADNCQ